ncbi:hypothetical protein N7451_012636 [Penicillium sp. IBT 35674x]|nr:hypothetical protein N7451_012636 [Penicillium sp. IBT 35674x]
MPWYPPDAHMASNAPQCFYQARDLSHRVLAGAALRMCASSDRCLVVSENGGRSGGKTDAFELHGVDRVSFQRAEHRDGIAPGRGGRSAYAMCRATPVGVAYGQVWPVGLPPYC